MEDDKKKIKFSAKNTKYSILSQKMNKWKCEIQCGDFQMESKHWYQPTYL